MSSANKFLQKIWDLNNLIKESRNSENNQDDSKFKFMINNFAYKIDQSISQFRFNVSIALFYETYNFFKSHINKKVSNKVLKDSIIKILKLMIPFVPHLAHECLELHKCKNFDDWPKIEKNDLEEINIAVQINGKTRDILSIKKDLKEKEIKKIVMKNTKTNKFISDKKILKVIYVKNRIINFIIKA